ncbi:hypothetical protein F5Y08DRAFT_273108 [Xylaria arbuscula]|nr:hypothetical protein F5Y08DRAFT_273108 [Xylaria arbuscula]
MSSAQLQSEPATQPEGDIDISSAHPAVPEDSSSGATAQSGGPEAGIKELIRFLRKTPPPPSNYMSIPDNLSSSSEEDRWDKFKKIIFRYRSKAHKRRPPIIMLPDSAVSARTIEGHRYIAISIPTEQSPTTPLTESQYPVYDSAGTSLEGEVNYMFGGAKKPYSARLIPVLNPVVEDRESTASSSPERPPQPTTPLTSASRRRSQSNPLLPSEEQRYNPRKRIHLSKSKSVSGGRPPALLSDTTAKTQSPGWKHVSWPVTAEPTIHPFEKPTVFPPRRSSRRGKDPETMRREGPEQPVAVAQDSPQHLNEGNSNGNGDNSGERARLSVSASIDTTESSSPQLLKAQTATAVHPVPIVVTQSGSIGPESPLDLASPEFPIASKGDNPAGPPPPSAYNLERVQRRKRKVREIKVRDTGKMKVRIDPKGKGKAAVSEPFTPDMPASSASPQEYSHQHRQQEDTSSAPTSSSSSSSARRRSLPGAESFGRRVGGGGRGRGEERAEREARYIAHALAEQRETLEDLPREELLRRYEALRENRAYERERRLRRLERSRDTWIQAMPILLQDLNGLLREQRRILENFGAYAGPSGLRGQQQGQHHYRRRSRSVEALPSTSLSSEHGRVEPLEVQRSKSVHGSSQPRSSH